jgi:hypothetical protein
MLLLLLLLLFFILNNVVSMKKKTMLLCVELSNSIHGVLDWNKCYNYGFYTPNFSVCKGSVEYPSANFLLLPAI